jgi:hypothetical protein
MEFSKEQLALIKKTCVPKNANQEHIDQFLYVASKYDLDPLTKEVVLDVRVNRKTGERRAVIITTRDGYLKIAMASPDYNGVNGGVIREGNSSNSYTCSERAYIQVIKPMCQQPRA